MRRLLPALLVTLAPLAAGAADPGWKASGSAEWWSYYTLQDRRHDSLLNPGNRVADLPSRQWTAEARFNFRLTVDGNELILRPRLLQTHLEGVHGQSDRGEAYFSQAFLRLRLGDGLTATAGRELLTWGPGNFRSPSHPLYFDAGRTNPLREVSGLDLARLTWTSGPLSAMLARVVAKAHADPAPPLPIPTTLGKVDWRGRDGMASVVVAAPVHSRPFVGAFAQYTPDDAWLLYGEAGSGRRAYALQPGSGGEAAFPLQKPSPRRTTMLLGAAYTLLNGQTLSAEVLHDGHGYHGEQGRAYFAQAQRLSAQAGTQPMALRALRQALGQAPALLGRDYLSLLWQSNPQDSDRYWRAMFTANLADGSRQASFYLDQSLAPRIGAFLLAIRNFGPRHSEFAMLTTSQLTVGVKLFLF